MRYALCLSLLALLLGAGPAAGLFGQTATDVGIDEKLGVRASLDSALKDEEGNPVTLRQVIDKPTILTLNYFRCTGICTPLLNGVADMLNEIGMEPGRDFQVITVSFDPQDTPEIAHEKRINYLKEMRKPIMPSAWRFLTGEGKDTKQLADSVGFKFRADGDQFLHAGAIIVLTPEGIVSRYLYGIQFLPADVQIAVREAASGKIRPSIARYLEYCYTFDPVSRQYVLNVTRIAGAGVLLSIGGFLIYLLKRRSHGKKEKARISA